MSVQNIRIAKIQVPDNFKYSVPKQSKINEKVELIEKGEPLTVTIVRGNIIVDGYTVYLAYKRLGMTKIPYEYAASTDSWKYIAILGEAVTLSDKIKLRDSCKCYICERVLPIEELTVDHVIPQSKGGSSKEDNLRCCCPLCNVLKGQFTYSRELVRVVKNELKERGIL